MEPVLWKYTAQDTRITSKNRFDSLEIATTQDEELALTLKLLRSIARGEQDVSEGNVSPIFSNTDEALQWLEQDE